MTDSTYYVPKTQKAVFGNIAAWVIALVVLGGAVSGGLWAFGVFSSNTKGAGDAIRQKNSAVNRIQKQEMFEQLNADIDGYIAKIAVAKQAYAANATDANQTNLVGVTQQCIDTVQQYNAESGKYTSRDFKSADLPYTRSAKECS